MEGKCNVFLDSIGFSTCLAQDHLDLFPRRLCTCHKAQIRHTVGH